MTNLLPLDSLGKKDIFSRKNLKANLKQKNIEVDDSTLSRRLNKLIDEGIIKRENNGYIFIESPKKIYHYHPSEKLKEIISLISDTYPNLDFVAWEYVQLNEFITHLIGKNAFIIETEKFFEHTLFELLNQNFPRVFLDISYQMFSLYSLDEPIIIKKMISRTPQNKTESHQLMLEKLIVDLLQDPFSSKLITNAEKKTVFANCFNTYYINSKTLNSYAERRNAKLKLDKFLNSLNEGE